MMSFSALTRSLSVLVHQNAMACALARPTGLHRSATECGIRFESACAQEAEMIVGHGVDVQDVSRIRKLLEFAEEDFLASTFTGAERAIECGDQEQAEF